MMMPYSLFSFGGLHTDYSKKIVLGLDYTYEYRGNNSAMSYELKPGITFRPFRTFKIGVTGDYIDNTDDLQYVATTDYISEKRYILGTIDQKTVGLTLRLDLNITPEFSIQYYGSPFISRGSYSEFKYVTNAVADAYNDRFTIYDNVVLSDGNYLLDENNDMITGLYHCRIRISISISSVPILWQNGNTVWVLQYILSGQVKGPVIQASSQASIKESYKELRSIFPNNIFLIKFNYWFSL